MASKTFLQLVTDALTQCDELSGSGSSTARAIIKAGINESYAEIAGIRDWETLDNDAAITTVSGTFEYTPVTASSTVCRIRRMQSILNETSNQYLEETERKRFEQAYPYVDPSSSDSLGTPSIWFVSGYTDDRDMKVKVYPVPGDTLTLRAHFTEEPLELSSDTDVPRIPDQFHYGLTYGAIAKYFEFQKDPISTYYRGLHEEFKRKILSIEFDDTDEMPEVAPLGRQKAVIKGKLGRIYN